MVILACQPPHGSTETIETQSTNSGPPAADGTCQLNSTGYGTSFCEDDFQVPANPPPQHSPVSDFSPNQHQVHAQSSVQYIRGQNVPNEYYSSQQPNHSYNGPPRQQVVQGNSDFNPAVPELNYMQAPQYPMFNQGPYFPPQTFEIPDIEVSNSVYSLDAWASNMAAPLHCHLATVKTNQVAPTSPESVEDSSSGDDSISLSQLTHKRTAGQALGHHMPHVVPTPVVKKPKPPKKRKKRDPNEPQKPVSAYALFFRDTQAAIKSRNPSASFGEVSKLVASMWDQLEEDHKNVYKKRTEMAKKEYLKQLAAYRASLVCLGSTEDVEKNRLVSNRSHPLPSMGSPLNPMGSSPLSHPMHNGMMGPPPHSMAPPQSLAPQTSSLGTMSHMSSPIGMRMNPDAFMNNQVMVSSPKPPPSMGSSPDPTMQGVPNHCQNSPLSSSPWDGEYCSGEITSQNRDLYSNWTPPSSQSTVK